MIFEAYFPCFSMSFTPNCYNLLLLNSNYKQTEEEKVDLIHRLHSREEKAWPWIMQFKQSLKELCLPACCPVLGLHLLPGGTSA